MIRALSYIALLGLVLSLIIQGAALVQINLADTWPELWALHLGALLVFVLFIWHSRSLTTARKAYWSNLLKPMPRGTSKLIGLAFIYLLFNFGCLLYQHWQGPLMQQGSSYWQLTEQGRQLLSAEQIGDLKLQEIRLFSGHWLFFYLLPYLYFRYSARQSTQG